jgi:hypothetical protein
MRWTVGETGCAFARTPVSYLATLDEFDFIRSSLLYFDFSTIVGISAAPPLREHASSSRIVVPFRVKIGSLFPTLAIRRHNLAQVKSQEVPILSPLGDRGIFATIILLRNACNILAHLIQPDWNLS